MPDLRKGLYPPALRTSKLHRDGRLAVGVSVCEGTTSCHGKPELEGFVGLYSIGQALLQKVRGPPVFLHLPLGLQRFLVLDMPNVGPCNGILPSHVLLMRAPRLDLAVPCGVLEVNVVLPRRILRAHVAARPAVCEVFALELADGIFVETLGAVVNDEWHAIPYKLLESFVIKIGHTGDLGRTSSIEAFQRHLRVISQEGIEVLDTGFLKYWAIDAPWQRTTGDWSGRCCPESLPTKYQQRGPTPGHPGTDPLGPLGQSSSSGQRC
mmetsp:Transcript_101091/g.182444  ORF Transcript_101091/g.182444 Transcript_101091/m.182444 type:complete len:266 (+) Transcript_101091:1247-2044(+)